MACPTLAAPAATATVSLSDQTHGRMSMRSLEGRLGGKLFSVGSAQSANFQRISLSAVPSSRGNGAMTCSMVVAPAKRGAEVEFETSLFKKEKVNFAGHEEVIIFLIFSSAKKLRACGTLTQSIEVLRVTLITHSSFIRFLQ